MAFFFAFWICAVSYRLVALQIVQYGEFVHRANRQQQRTIDVSPKRGIIYDRNGKELAMTVNVDSVFAVPAEIPDAANTAELLARVLKVSSTEVETRLKSSRSFAWVARKIDSEQSARIRALNLRGIYFQKESKRFYPKRELAAQVLGYVGMDDEGLGGIERAFDARLQGKAGKMLISVDAKRRWFGRVERQPEPGENVVLTIDEKIQYIAERELERAMAETRSEAATVVVQHPRTGEILALANRPTFDPNRFRTAEKVALKNRAVSDIYEPGSTFKIVTVAAALEEKLTTPEEVIDCQNGAIYIGNVRIRDHHPYGLLSVDRVMAHSSGVGTIKLGLRLGEHRFEKYIRGFGFGAHTGIELPGETRGLAKPASRWSKVSIGAISMGQEIGASALQVSAMTAAIANDGVYVPPRIVAGTTKPRGGPQTVEFRPAEGRRVVSTMTAAQLKNMMESVVLFGTGKKALLEGYTSAGKTGTAQKTDPVTGAYHPWKHVASFSGFAPLKQPAVVITVILDSPVGLHQGGQVAAPLFARIAQQVLAYMNVPHDIEMDESRLRILRAKVRNEDLIEAMPDRVAGGLEITPELAAAAAAELESRSTAPGERAEFKAASFTPLAPAAPAQGGGGTIPVYVARQQKTEPVWPPPQEDPKPPARGTAVLDVYGGLVVPSFEGKSVRAALEVAQEAGVEIDVIGSGVAREQMPPPGARIAAGRRVAVRFAR